ncbi:hypothetical protein SDC9_143881 [bioreactor metagenome]|uniref:IS110 family transposase n=1 Tax=bioreactor metagenome TaxID=1076179 RepID=A0A645E5D2_9ZZZZ
MILDCVQNDGDTIRDYQASRDFITQSLVRDLERQQAELSQIDAEIEKMLATFDYKLTTLPGVGSAIAGKLIAEIGDIRRLRTDSGEMASRPIETEISMEDASLAQKGPQSAYDVIIKYDKMGSFKNV